MSAIYSRVYSTTPVDGAVVVQTPVLSSTQLEAADSSAAAPVLLITEPAKLIQLLPQLKQLASRRIVVQVSTAATRDHSPVVALRGSSTAFAFIYSSTQQQAAANALVAAKVASHGHAVVHFGEFDNAVDLGSATVGREWLAKPLAVSTANGHTQTNGDAHKSSLSGTFSSVYATLPAEFATEPFAVSGAENPSTVIVALGNVSALASALPADTRLVLISQYRPLSTEQIRAFVPASTRTVVVLEQAYKQTTKWSPLFLDVVGAFADDDSDAPAPAVLSGILGEVSDGAAALKAISDAVASGSHPFTVGSTPSVASTSNATTVSVPKHESTYTNLLSEVFGDRLWLANSPTSLLPAGAHVSATSPEYALGHVLGAAKQREAVRASVRSALSSSDVEDDVAKALTAWLQDDGNDKKTQAAISAIAQSRSAPVAALRNLELRRKSNWIVGSEAWSHDLGASGLHHALSTGADVNLLLIDTTPYSLPGEGEPLKQRRKDAGLYAMTYGNAYVASCAVYGDFSQTLRALADADAYKGPSIVLAYLPGGEKDSTRALDLLKSTKKAIEIGTWPLYRWDPSAEFRGQEVFELDSEKIKAEMRTFLDRQNHLTELSNRLPTFGEALEGSYYNTMVAAQKKKAREAFDALSGALEGPPLLVLFASDGGNAEKLAKKFATRARTRGVAARTLAFDDMALNDLPLETNVAFITSVAGQGEFPQNGREFWKAMQAGKVSDLANVNFSVFGLGDSHYWPRPEDAHYYNKPAKDLHKALLALNAVEMVELGLGDDQDPDGPQTAYKMWEPKMWKALGVDSFETNEPELEPITNEHIKIASKYLRGTVKEGLEDTSTGALAESDGQITKFHGIYQQDDRDIRDERKAAGLEPAYSFMVRMRLPGGVCTPAQWLAVDEISDRRGNHTFKLTTRQTFQFHGIVKANLKPAIQEINRMALDTIAACGDVNRTVVSCSALGPLHEKVFAFSRELSDGLKPQTSAYAEIWLDQKQVYGEAVHDVEPLYGEYYLPRKFKIAIAVPPTNDVDVFCHDLGYIAILDDNKELLGYNVTIGGGMGVTHSMKTTYPRLADVIGFVKPEQGLEVAKAVLLTQRDNGNRANRKNARVKYTVDRMGLDNFKAEVEKRLGYKLDPARPYSFTSNVDEFGWQTGHDGRRHFTAFVENGRVQDEPGRAYKTALREIAKVHKGVFRLTPNQHVIIADIPPSEEKTIQQLLHKHGLDKTDFSALRLSSAACVAFPTCGLAMAESERYLPVLIDKVEELMEESGLRNDSITMRMTGCPNGCARPWAAEIAFVGKAPGSYLMLLGGGYYGQRLNKIYREAVGEQEILDILKPMIKSYALERNDGEHFGDFVIRKGIISATKSGKEFYDGASPGVAVEA
ncbi:Sulfite reductase [NADPH] subunit beta [Microbotryomycetes sp. JL201]|nr:Sulfite reductase [NADPH] subunit beta [Microbotryomycetes sp. JL201]KAK4049182.1 Sulfite reductase [NADPH] subunit beta [Microbotryomycetes sp. JL201]